MNTIRNPKPKAQRNFSERLLEWYSVQAREMPWRVMPENHALGERQNPYFVWISEIMLQQTQVATVKDYYLKFIQTWPTVQDLAGADREDVLKAWAGLGYYSRARNLKKCAEEIVENHAGEFPANFEALKKLPGIGDYTASAIAAIAFDQPVPVVDGNVERVVSRHNRIEDEFPKAKGLVKDILSRALDAQKPGEFAQAMMDLGATICTPKNPDCARCPINDDCRAFENGDQARFPRKQPKKAKPLRRGAAFVIRNSENQVFLCKRSESGLLAGMTQVPTTDWSASTDGETGENSLPFAANWRQRGIARHTFTHFHLELEVWEANQVEQHPTEGWWSNPADLKSEALPTVMRKVLTQALLD